MYSPGDLVFFDRRIRVSAIESENSDVSALNEFFRSSTRPTGYEVRGNSPALVIRPYEKADRMSDCGSHPRAYVIVTDQGIGWTWTYELFDVPEVRDFSR